MVGIKGLVRCFEKFLDIIQIITTHINALLILGIGVVMLYMVLARYFFDYNLIWGNVILTGMMVWGTFLVLGSVTRKRMHIRIGFFSNVIFKKRAPLVQYISEGFVGLPFCLYMAWHSWSWVDYNREGGFIQFVGNDTYEEWIPEMVIPMGFIIGAIFYLEQCIRQLYQLYIHLSQRKHMTLPENQDQLGTENNG